MSNRLPATAKQRNAILYIGNTRFSPTDDVQTVVARNLAKENLTVAEASALIRVLERLPATS